MILTPGVCGELIDDPQSAPLNCGLYFNCILQIQQEIRGVLDFLKRVYGVLGFTYKLELSTRPKKYLGDIEVWNSAEKVGLKTM